MTRRSIVQHYLKEIDTELTDAELRYELPDPRHHFLFLKTQAGNVISDLLRSTVRNLAWNRARIRVLAKAPALKRKFVRVVLQLPVRGDEGLQVRDS